MSSSTGESHDQKSLDQAHGLTMQDRLLALAWNLSARAPKSIAKPILSITGTSPPTWLGTGTRVRLEPMFELLMIMIIAFVYENL